MGGFFIFAEDVLGEKFAANMVSELDFEVAHSQFVGGWGHLKKNLPKYRNLASRGRHVFIITDLDQGTCAPELIQEWAGDVTFPESLLLRVCVHEIESWIMADRETLAHFLGFAPQNLPLSPDEISAPKQYLFDKVAKKSRSRAIKSGILPGRGARVGPMYNSLLIKFLETDYRLEEARKHSHSLDRALRALLRCRRTEKFE